MGIRNIWRDPGAEVLVGLLGFAVSFIAIGLALITVKQVCYAYVTFAISGMLFIVSVMVTISLLRHFAKTRGYIQQIGRDLNRGYILRNEILKSLTPELEKKVTQWENDVQKWLDNNLPDYASDFPLEIHTGTMDSFTGPITAEAFLLPLILKEG